MIGEDSDWDNVEIQNTNDSNKPLVDLVRQRKEGRPLMILADPQDQTVEDGKTALFYVYAVGKYELDYHWQHSWDGGATWTAIDSDGAVDVSDAVLIARFAVGDVSAKIKDIGVLNGDVNGDGNTDIQDVTFVLMFIAKRITLFPVEET